MAPDNVIYHYQTLITGTAALVAAFLAGWPVWRQLAMMRAQSEAMLRSIVVQRLKDTKARSRFVDKTLSSTMSRLNNDLHYAEEMGRQIDEFWASDVEQALYTSFRQLRSWSDSHRDIESIEIAKSDLLNRIEDMTQKLNEVHWPHHNQQHDEDHSISDADWQHMLRRSDEAKDELSDDAAALRGALSALYQAYQEHSTALNLRLREIDDLLLGEKRPMRLRWRKRKEAA